MENIKYNQNNEILKNIINIQKIIIIIYSSINEQIYAINLYTIFFFFLPIYFDIIEPLFPAATKISRRRRLHRLQSTHTRPLSRRNTAGRIIMYSISLRGLPLALLPPSDLLSFSRTPLALSHGGKGAGKKKTRRMQGRRESEKVPAQEDDGEGDEGWKGVSLTPLKRDTRIHSLLDPTPSPLLILTGFATRGRKGGREAVCCLFNATFTGKRTLRRGTREGEAEGEEGGKRSR